MTGSVAPNTQRDQQRPTKNSTSRLIAAILFTASEVWAIGVVLQEIHPSGSSRAALALALAATVIAVVDSWRDIRGSRRFDR